MADEPKNKVEQTEKNAKKSNFVRKLIVMIGVILVQVIISYVIIAFILKPSGSTANESPSSEPKKEEKKSDANEGVIIGLDDIVINPSDTKGRRFVFISLGIELEPGKPQEEIKKRIPAISDAVLTLLSQKPLSEFIEVVNRDILRQEVLLKIKEVTSSNLVHQIYFTKFIIR
jgi:flagellar basal body-associated protein FliL